MQIELSPTGRYVLQFKPKTRQGYATYTEHLEQFTPFNICVQEHAHEDSDVGDLYDHRVMPYESVNEKD